MSDQKQVLLELNKLKKYFPVRKGVNLKAVEDISLKIYEGEKFGVVGESGCGKSVTARSLMGLTEVTGGRCQPGSQILCHGENILDYSKKQWQSYRGRDAAMIFQDAMTSLNPTMQIGHQIAECYRFHQKIGRKEALEKASEMLALVGISDPEAALRRYPHEFSGGMRQRVMIAMAMSSDPKILIADEPTTALDVTIQAQILHLLLELQKKNNMSIILITHDLGVVAQTCKRVAVMCGGYVVEEGTVEEIFLHPGHPYTQALIASMPRVGGTFEQFLERDLSDGNGDLCPFLNRCKYADKTCEACLPKYYEASEGHRIFCHKREEKR